MLRAIFLAALCVAFALLGPAQAKAQILVGTPSTAHPAPPATIYLGMFVNTLGKTGTLATKEADLENIESSAGRRLAFQLSFFNQSALTAKNLSTHPQIQGDLTYHRIPYVAWNVRSTNGLLDFTIGKNDNQIAQAAIALKNLNVPVYMRWFWEFNLCLNTASSCPNGDFKNSFPAGYTIDQEAALYVAAWEHIWNIFQAKGAYNVVWVFCPAMGSGNTLTTAQMQEFIPPDPYVDWLGFDKYDPGATNGFVTTLNAAYSVFSGYGKPIFWSETGEVNSSCVTSVNTQQKYFTDAIANLQTNYPLIHGFGVFDAWPTNPNCSRDWLLDAAGLSEFITLSNNSYFTAMGY